MAKKPKKKAVQNKPKRVAEVQHEPWHDEFRAELREHQSQALDYTECCAEIERLIAALKKKDNRSNYAAAVAISDGDLERWRQVVQAYSEALDEQNEDEIFLTNDAYDLDSDNFNGDHGEIGPIGKLYDSFEHIISMRSIPPGRAAVIFKYNDIKFVDFRTVEQGGRVPAAVGERKRTGNNASVRTALLGEG